MIWLFTLLAIILLPGIWLHGPKLTLAVLPAQNAMLDFSLKPAADISGVFIDEDGEPIHIYEQARGYATMNDPSVMDGMSLNTWSSTGYRNKYSPKSFQEWRQAGISFESGRGDYNGCSMVFPADNSFLIEAIMPGETHLSFYPQEQGMEVKKILYNGKNIMEVRELPEEAMNFMPPAAAVLGTRAGETIEGVTIVLGPVVNSPSS